MNSGKKTEKRQCYLNFVPTVSKKTTIVSLIAVQFPVKYEQYIRQFKLLHEGAEHNRSNSMIDLLVWTLWWNPSIGDFVGLSA